MCEFTPTLVTVPLRVDTFVFRVELKSRDVTLRSEARGVESLFKTCVVKQYKR